MTKFQGRPIRFTYFDLQLGSPDWIGKRVLDFGGNGGNLLREPDCRIAPQDYWCIDVSESAIDEGRRSHPEAHFICYDRYNYEYNPTGVVGLPVPDPGVKFDFILLFSVINNISKAEMHDLVGQLLPLLAAGGRLVFNFLDPLWAPPPGPPHTVTDPAFRTGWSNLYEILEEQHGGELKTDFPELLARARETRRKAESKGWSNLRQVLRQVHLIYPEMDVEAVIARAESTPLTWVSLVNGETLVVDPDDEGHPETERRDPTGIRVWAHRSFCTAEYMSRLFPQARIRPPVAGDRQHCVIIEAGQGARGDDRPSGPARR